MSIMRLLKKKKGLTEEQKRALLYELGLRVIEVEPPKTWKKDVNMICLLVPTFKGEWVREHAKSIGSKWDGSWLSLIYYKNNTLGLLVGHELVDKWKYVADKISEVVKMPIYVIPD